MHSINRTSKTASARIKPVAGQSWTGARRSMFDAPNLLIGILALTLLTQRFAIDAGGYPLTASLLLAPPLFLLLLHRRLVIDRNALFLYCLLCAHTLASLMLSNDGRPTSAVLYLYLYGIFILKTPFDSYERKRFVNSAIGLGAILACGALLQFALQFVLPPENLFTWRNILPATVLYEYNTLNVLWYGAGIYKANGLVFLESSVFAVTTAKFFSLAIVEQPKIVALALMGCALIASYSGTAWLGVALFLALYLCWPVKPNEGFARSRLILALVAAGALLLLLAPSLNLDRYLTRIAELQDTSGASSGGQRFLVPLQATFHSVSNSNLLELLFGRGPGVSDDYLNVTGASGVASAWAKQIIEYGPAGFALYMLFFGYTLGRSITSFPLAVMIFVDVVFITPSMLVPPIMYAVYFAFCAVPKDASLNPEQPAPFGGGLKTS